MTQPLTTRPPDALVNAALRCQGRRDHYSTGTLRNGTGVVAADPLGVLSAEVAALRAVEQAARAWATEWADSGGDGSIEPAAAHLADLLDETAVS